MRLVANVFTLGLVLAGIPLLAHVPPVAVAAIAIAACVGASIVTSETRSALAVSLGAIAAVAGVSLAPVSTEITGGVVIALLLGARTVRARNDAQRGIALLTSLVSGAAAASIVAHYASASVGLHAAAVLVAGVIASLALIVPADDAVAWTLVHYARELGDASRPVLLRAATLRRDVDGDIEGLSSSAHRRLEQAWQALETTARSRVLARGASADVLDQRIASHVDALERAYAAADERFARSTGLDDHALRGVRAEADALAAEASALAEVAEAPSQLGAASAPRS